MNKVLENKTGLKKAQTKKIRRHKAFFIGSCDLITKPLSYCRRLKVETHHVNPTMRHPPSLIIVQMSGMLFMLILQAQFVQLVGALRKHAHAVYCNFSPL